jgi:hypothetical protein
MTTQNSEECFNCEGATVIVVVNNDNSDVVDDDDDDDMKNESNNDNASKGKVNHKDDLDHVEDEDINEYDDDDDDCDSFCDAQGNERANKEYLKKDLGASCLWSSIDDLTFYALPTTTTESTNEDATSSTPAPTAISMYAL